MLLPVPPSSPHALASEWVQVFLATGSLTDKLAAQNPLVLPDVRLALTKLEGDHFILDPSPEWTQAASRWCLGY